MKKIHTLLALFALFNIKKCRLKKDIRLFDEIFQRSGKIRESQLNLKYLQKYGLGDFEMLSFRDKLELDEKIHLRNFLMAASAFDEKNLGKISLKVKQLIVGMDIGHFIIVAKKFIRRKVGKIRQLQIDMNNKKNVHKIRKHMKSIATVVTVLYLIQPDENSIKYLSDLNRTEKMLGAWHDKVVFLGLIDKFIAKSARNPNQSVMSIQQLKKTINEECDNMFGQFTKTWAL